MTSTGPARTAPDQADAPHGERPRTGPGAGPDLQDFATAYTALLEIGIQGSSAAFMLSLARITDRHTTELHGLRVIYHVDAEQFEVQYLL